MLAETFCSTRKVHAPILGAAMIEAALTIPLVVILLIGTLNYGNLIAQLAWMSQTATEALLVGAEYNDANERTGIMGNRVNQLTTWYEQITRHSAPMGTLGFQHAQVTDNSSGTAVNLIEVELNGALPTLMGPIELLPIKVTMRGPILAIDSAALNLNTFSNPAVLYDCAGNVCDASLGNCSSSTTCLNCVSFLPSPPFPANTPDASQGDCACAGSICS